MRAIKGMFEGPIFNDYRGYLLKIGNLRGNKYKNYTKLFTYLLMTPFIFKNNRDKNRARDGLDLREDFLKERGIQTERLDENVTECSMLEMLIALSIRVDKEYIGDPSDPNPDLFFWDLIVNSALDYLDNNGFDPDLFNYKMDQIYSDRINMFLMRGSTQEIWSQMLAYVSTHY